MSETFEYDVFLSYNQADKPQVRRLAERLKAADLRVWFDEWVIKPGDDIYWAIECGLEVTRTLVLCLSQAALGSGWVRLERNTVLFRDPSNFGRRFIPLLLADCKLPDTLRRYKYVDYREETQAAFEQLLAGCRPNEQRLIASSDILNKPSDKDKESNKAKILSQDSNKNLQDMNLTLYSAKDDFGINAFSIGEAVKFTAPTDGWKIKIIQVLGWNGFNHTEESIPQESSFLLEIRDQNKDLLYRMADTQNAYFTFPVPLLRGVDIPSIPVSGDFYVVFYDRGSMRIAMEQESGTGKSYFFNNLNKEISPAQFTIGEKGETIIINWIIRVIGNK